MSEFKVGDLVFNDDEVQAIERFKERYGIDKVYITQITPLVGERITICAYEFGGEGYQVYPKFKAGDIVRCVDVRNNELILGNIYQVVERRGVGFCVLNKGEPYACSSSSFEKYLGDIVRCVDVRNNELILGNVYQAVERRGMGFCVLNKGEPIPCSSSSFEKYRGVL